MTLQAKSYDLRLRVLEMIHIGEKPVFSGKGLVTSLAWGMEGKVDYVLEGNINYTGAVTKWVVEELGLLTSSKEAGPVAQSADPADTTYLVPAFTGLGAPYWDSGAKAMLYGMSCTTGRAEIVKAAEECIAYQIANVLELMGKEAGVAIQELRVDGGPTKDKFLMQFRSGRSSPAWERPSARASRRGCTARRSFKPCAGAVSCPSWRRRCAGKRERAGSRRWKRCSPGLGQNKSSRRSNLCKWNVGTYWKSR